MNQDQVKETLLRLNDDVAEFTVIFSGKTSKKVHGLYHPEAAEIIIHNRNFSDDSALMYTAIHEFAHHIHFTGPNPPKTSRAHTNEFRYIFHTLLDQAEKSGIYSPASKTSPELQKQAEFIKSEYIEKYGEMMKAFGMALMEAEKECRKQGVRFEDFVERDLQLGQTTVKQAMRMKAQDIPQSWGMDGMKTESSIRNKDQREEFISSIKNGQSLDQAKHELEEKKQERRKNESTASVEKQITSLERDKKRISKTISTLQEKLDTIDTTLENLRETIDEHPMLAAADGVSDMIWNEERGGAPESGVAGDVTESKCTVCGSEYVIEHNSSHSFRSDNKRIFRSGDDSSISIFRCHSCHRPVHETVPGAQFGSSA
jgi:hypothetical protein